MKPFLFFIISSLFFCCPSQSFAGSLTITGDGTFKTTIESSDLILEIDYSIKNSGDEVAQRVFPEFSLGDWAWVGEEVELFPDSKHAWKSKQRIPLEQLKCSKKSNCLVSGEKIEGIYPLKILRHYRDANGHPFSSVNGVALQVSGLPGAVLAKIKSPPFVARAGVEFNGSEYDVTFDLHNRSNNKIELGLSLLLPRELSLKSITANITLDAGEKKSIPVQIENFSGLVGSVYSSSAAFQWTVEGYRAGYIHSFLIPIEKQRTNFPWLVMLSGLIGVLVFFFGVKYVKKTAT